MAIVVARAQRKVSLQGSTYQIGKGLSMSAQRLTQANVIIGNLSVKVTPTFVAYEGDDPAGYALAVNIARRHMTKGPTAIVVVRAQRQPGGEKLTNRQAGKTLGIDHTRLSQANTIIEFLSSPERA